MEPLNGITLFEDRLAGGAEVSSTYTPNRDNFLGAVVGGALGFLGARGLAKSAGEAADQAAYAMQLQLDWARELWEDYKTLYRPLEQEVVTAAREGVVRPEVSRARAVAEVGQQMDISREISRRSLGRFGIDPSSGAFAGMERGFALGRAAGAAGAGTSARERAEDINRQYRLNVLSFGKGLPAQATAAVRGAGQTALGLSGLYGQGAANVAGFVSGLPWDEIISGIGGLFGGGASAGDINLQTGQTASGLQLNLPYRDGGLVKKPYREGGEIVGPGTGTSDSVPIDASDGEYVIPADVVKVKGTEFFDKLLERYHSPRGLPAAGVA